MDENEALNGQDQTEEGAAPDAEAQGWDAPDFAEAPAEEASPEAEANPEDFPDESAAFDESSASQPSSAGGDSAGASAVIQAGGSEGGGQTGVGRSEPSAEDGKAEEEKKKPRSTILTFAVSLAVMALFVILCVLILTTNGEGKAISALLYILGAMVLMYLLIFLPLSDEKKSKTKEQLAAEKAAKKKRTRGAKAVSTLGMAFRLILLTGVLVGGLLLIIVSNTFSDMVAIAMLFVCLLMYFIAVQNF